MQARVVCCGCHAVTVRRVESNWFTNPDEDPKNQTFKHACGRCGSATPHNVIEVMSSS